MNTVRTQIPGIGHYKHLHKTEYSSHEKSSPGVHPANQGRGERAVEIFRGGIREFTCSAFGRKLANPQSDR